VRRVTLDSNIYLSALNFGGLPLLLLDMGVRGEIEIAISDAILQEVLRVQRDKFKAPPENLKRAKRLIEGCTHRVAPVETLIVVSSDPDDNRIVECAVTAGSEAIITGDKDLLRLVSYRGVEMQTIRDFLQRGSGSGKE
jgi:putative PIN family toxin of toxin-antitoxin system